MLESLFHKVARLQAWKRDSKGTIFEERLLTVASENKLKAVEKRLYANSTRTTFLNDFNLLTKSTDWFLYDGNIGR